MIRGVNHVIVRHEGDMDEIRTFFKDFGMVVAHEDEQRIYFRGYEDRPYIYVAERGPKEHVDLSGEWGEAVGKVKALDDVPEWRLAVVLESSAAGLSVGLQPAKLASGALEEKRETGQQPDRTDLHECSQQPRAGCPDLNSRRKRGRQTPGSQHQLQPLPPSESRSTLPSGS